MQPTVEEYTPLMPCPNKHCLASSEEPCKGEGYCDARVEMARTWRENAKVHYEE